MNRIFIFIICISFLYKANGQGCSDAGFCTAGGLRPILGQSEPIQNSLGFTIGYSLGEQRTSYITPQFEPQVKVSDKGMIQVKIPIVFIYGELGNSQGLGDVILTYNHQFDSLWKQKISLTVGTRIGTGTSSFKIDDIALPMPYQRSLGTTDLILGAKIFFKKGFSLSVGFQQPLVNINQNGFDSSAFYQVASNYDLKPEDNYFISSNLKRKGDLMLRIDKSFEWKKRFISVGILPIYHLGKDVASISKGQETKIEGSQGLTLNINASIAHKISSKCEISSTVAVPLIVRDSRPDGLTRSLILVAGLRYFL